jgi:hypothetical protein
MIGVLAGVAACITLGMISGLLPGAIIVSVISSPLVYLASQTGMDADYSRH